MHRETGLQFTIQSTPHIGIYTCAYGMEFFPFLCGLYTVADKILNNSGYIFVCI